MSDKPISMAITVGIICAIVGGIFGLFGGISGSITGIASGYTVGHIYVLLIYAHRSRNIFLRMLAGTFLGGLCGTISGISVHIPSLMLGQNPLFRDDFSGLWLGAFFGVIIGAILGFIGGCTISAPAYKQPTPHERV